MKRITATLIGLGALAAFGVAAAQEGKTWETQETVWNVTAIRIFPNADEQYLNNLKRTWVTGMEQSMKEGLVTDYKILASVTPLDEGYNLLIITESPNLGALDATAEWREKILRIDANVEKIISEEETDRITSTVYPEVREILSQKLMREIKFID
jgi:hypothetical protein